MLRTRCTNRVILTGYVGESVDYHMLKDDVAVAHFYLGLPYEDEQTDQETQWETHRVEVWRELAALCHQHLTKGSKVLVEGMLRVNYWSDSDEKPRVMTYIRAERVEFIKLKSGVSSA